MKRRDFLAVAAFGAAACRTIHSASGAAAAASSPALRHIVVYAEADRFAGWPANNGVWIWEGKEILVGFVSGGYKQQSGHNIVEPYRCLLARSRDGGETWAVEDPADFVGHGGAPTPLRNPIDFTRPGFAMRVVGTAYHGSDQERGAFFYSCDRGRTWHGPRTFGALADHPKLKDLHLTPRTDYLVEDPTSCLIFLSARDPRKAGFSDRIFGARTTDGGRTFEFVSWVVPFSDPYRAVMPSTVRCSPKRLVTAVRRRAVPEDRCWIDAYASEDTGKTWTPASKVGDTGNRNGNPPALARLEDGRLCCVYGNRTTQRILARISRDEGHTWDDEIVLRGAPASAPPADPDIGYPRLVQRADGKMVALYYWASETHPQQHIAATIWDPGKA